MERETKSTEIKEIDNGMRVCECDINPKPLKEFINFNGDNEDKCRSCRKKKCSTRSHIKSIREYIDKKGKECKACNECRQNKRASKQKHSKATYAKKKIIRQEIIDDPTIIVDNKVYIKCRRCFNKNKKNYKPVECFMGMRGKLVVSCRSCLDREAGYDKKTCVHNIISSQCGPCKGVSMCCHTNENKEKIYRRKAYCMECDGSAMCKIHKTRKSRCGICVGEGYGTELCEHRIPKSSCLQCGVKCPHGRLNRSRCRDCDGVGFCKPHKTRKYECIPCGGSQVCEHKKLRRNCKTCHGSARCREHNRFKQACRICDVSKSICNHKKRKNRCSTCKYVQQRQTKDMDLS